MEVPSRHVLQQGPVLAAIGRTAWLAVSQKIKRSSHSEAVPVCPGPVYERTCEPLPQALLDDFVSFLGGRPESYRGQVPAHLFPQWSLPIAARTLEGLTYPMLKVINGGCRMERRGLIPVGQPLSVQGQLTRIDDDGQRALLTERVVTGTAEQPELLIAEFHAYVPLAKKSGVGKKEKPSVPRDARKIATIKLPANAGLSFAKLTGDFNPIHWLAPYAKASGFKNVILHGFGTFALAAEALVQHVFDGDPEQLQTMEARFTRPLVLPAEVSVFVLAGDVFVGTETEKPAFMTGTFARKEQRHD